MSSIVRFASAFVLLCLVPTCGLGQPPQTDAKRQQMAEAIFDENVVAVKSLLEAGYSLELKDEFGATALFEAVSVSSVEIAKVLIEAGANVDTAEGEWGMPLFNMAVSTTEMKLMDLLLKHKCPFDKKDRYGGTAIEEAAFSGDKEAYKKCLSLGLKDPSPFHTACGLGDLDQVKKAIANGQDVNERNPSWKNSALMFAASGQHLDVVKYLLANGADPNLENVIKEVPLHFAASMETPELVIALLDAGAKVNHKMDDGGTALDWAHADSVISVLKSRGGKSGF